MADWWKVSRKCPSCATALNIQEIHQVSYKPTEATMQEEQNSSSPEASRQSSPGIYAGMDDRILKEIKRIDLKSYFGTKIDMSTLYLLRSSIWLSDIPCSGETPTLVEKQRTGFQGCDLLPME